MNLAQAISDSAQRNLTKIALYYGDAEYSYGDLWAKSLRVTQLLLHEFGVAHAADAFDDLPSTT